MFGSGLSSGERAALHVGVLLHCGEEKKEEIEIMQPDVKFA